MADTSAMQDLRGLSVDKLVKGFADEEIKLRNYVNVTNTPNRQIRWYQQTSGFLRAVTTSGITSGTIASSHKSLPQVQEQSWTRNNSYIKNFKIESPWFSIEDISDGDVDVLARNLKQLTRAVLHEEDLHIWDILSESQSASNIQSVSITHEWDDYSNCTPIVDILNCKRLILNENYDPEGAILLLNSNVHTYLVNWLINTKGANIPAFASQKVVDGQVMEILGLRIVISNVVTADYGVVFIPNRAVTLKEFKPITSYVLDEPGVAKKVRIVLESVALLTDPKCVVLLDNMGPS
jgi:hypothetical protein